jgi:uncharacterized membrane protein
VGINLFIEELKVNEKKQYTAEEVARGILNRAKELIEDHLKKAEKHSAKEEMKKIDPMNQNSAQMAEVDVPQPNPPKAQTKLIAKQPLKLKKFMEKMEAKRMAKSKNRCWEGYEPVPNKKPYTKGSCRKE